MVCGQVWWPILGICALHLTHPSAHTQKFIAYLEQWAANTAAPGEQLGVRCLAQGSHLSRGIEGGESAVHSLPPPTIPAGPETRTHNLLVTSPTRYPLGHDCLVNRTLINITDKKKTKKKHSYFKEKTSNLKCKAGNSGNINLCFFTVNYTFFFPLLKTVWYRKITWNVY